MASSCIASSAAAVLLLCLAAGAATFPDCIPENLEIDLDITVLANSKFARGFGRMYSDYKASNMSAINVTLFRDDGATETVLYISDFNANRTYTLNVSSGQCSSKPDACMHNLSYISSLSLGAGPEKLDVRIFNGTTGEEQFIMATTKTLCIPVHAIFRSDSSIKVMNFFNATIGIKNPKVLRIPDECRML